MSKKAIFYSNAENDAKFETARRVAGMFEKGGWETILASYPDKPDLSGADMLITFGGDGTILHAAREAAGFKIPLLGINMGGKGFIAELEPSDEEFIEKAVSGDYGIEPRMMIDIEVQRGGKVIKRDFALNDAVIKGNNKIIEMTVYADEQKITHFSGDGTVIATPTGSTAYSMSAGGPIVEPTAKNIIVTPICAHILEAKSFVLTAKRIVSIEIEQKKDVPAYLSVDGTGHAGIERGDVVRVSNSKKTASLVRISGESFYQRLSARLISRVN